MASSGSGQASSNERRRRKSLLPHSAFASGEWMNLELRDWWRLQTRNSCARWIQGSMRASAESVELPLRTTPHRGWRCVSAGTPVLRWTLVSEMLNGRHKWAVRRGCPFQNGRAICLQWSLSLGQTNARVRRCSLLCNGPVTVTLGAIDGAQKDNQSTNKRGNHTQTDYSKRNMEKGDRARNGRT